MKNNKLALITWASSWLWKEFAYIHAEKWWDLILIARRWDKLDVIKQDLETKYKNNIYIIVQDLSAINAWEIIYNRVLDLWLEVDYLINNAGFWWMWAFYQRNIDDDINMIQVNVIALTQLTSLFLKDFIKKDSWKILNVSSTASLIPGPLQSVYYATKAYVTSFSNSLYQEVLETNVSVTTLLPGATKTEFWDKSGMGKTKIFNTTADAYTVALDWYNGMLNNKLNVISGVTPFYRILLWFAPLFPKKIVLKIVNYLQK